MVLIYRRSIPKRLYNFFIFSLLAHASLFLFLGSRKPSTSNVFITEITYQEETQGQGPEALKSQTRVGYLIPPTNLNDLAKGVETSGPPGVGGYGGEASTQPVVDLNVKIDRSQAEINLDRYENGDEGALAVVRIADRTSGGVKSTDEILAEKPISLARNLPRGTGGSGGISVGSNIGLKSETPAIKIDKKPPPPKTSEIGKQVETKFEEKLKVEKAGTQISLAGPIANREILKKLLPRYPDWCLRKGISGMVKIKIWVEPSGRVREGILIEVSSGYPDLDQAVVNTIKSWLFAPLPANVIQESQWGVITFKFVCG